MIYGGLNAGYREKTEKMPDRKRAVADLHHPKKYGFIISNPPYGERLEEKSALPALYSQIGEAYKRLDAWSMYLITSYEDTERYIGRKAGISLL